MAKKISRKWKYFFSSIYTTCLVAIISAVTISNSFAEIHIDVYGSGSDESSKTESETETDETLPLINQTATLKATSLVASTSAPVVGSKQSFGAVNKNSQTFNGIPFYNSYIDNFSMSLIPEYLYDKASITFGTESASDSGRSITSNIGLSLSPFGDKNNIEAGIGNRGQRELGFSNYFSSKSFDANIRGVINKSYQNEETKDHIDSYGISAATRIATSEKSFLDITALGIDGKYQSTMFGTKSLYPYSLMLGGFSFNTMGNVLSSRTTISNFNFKLNAADAGFPPNNLTNTLTMAEKLDLTFFKNKDIKISPSIQYQNESFVADKPDTLDISRDLVKLSGDVEVPIYDLKLHYGISIDSSNAFDNHQSNLASAIYNFGKSSVYASYQEQYRLPSFGQVYYGTMGAAIYGGSDNLNLQPETSDKKEIGYRFSSKQFNASVSYFNIDFDDKIVFHDPNLWDYYINLESSYSNGYAVSGEYNNLLVLGADWTHIKSDDLSVIKDNVKSRIGVDVSKHRLILENEYYSENLGTHIPEYNIWNIRYVYDTDNWQVSVDMRNITDSAPMLPELLETGKSYMLKFKMKY